VHGAARSQVAACGTISTVTPLARSIDWMAPWAAAVDEDSIYTVQDRRFYRFSRADPSAPPFVRTVPDGEAWPEWPVGSDWDPTRDAWVMLAFPSPHRSTPSRWSASSMRT
jgi:hypothetical protein